SFGIKDATALFTTDGKGALGEKAAPSGYSRPNKMFKVEGDGTFIVNNTVRQLLKFRQEVAASKGFADRQPRAGLTERAT
ncbi:hypothetical protein, partial [Klebsiella pneumoniae]|uniref:hypothetical protein n=1 Tax=Klebsiella pneumoniae TaxID=573 RepID=UPI0025A24524